MRIRDRMVVVVRFVRGWGLIGVDRGFGGRERAAMLKEYIRGFSEKG